MITRSPTLTVVAGLVTARLTDTCPALQASVAMARVLKALTDHSHRSTLMLSNGVSLPEMIPHLAGQEDSGTAGIVVGDQGPRRHSSA